MFAYPKQTEFNQPVPKAKIYLHAKPNKRIKELFVSQVGEIVWRFKLAPETLNLPARNGINEIQVFQLALRTPDVDDAILSAIDKAVQFPLAFELIHGDTVRFACSYKRLSEADAAKWVIEAMFKTQPQPIDTPREPLPVVLDLAGLYAHIVRRHIPLASRNGEGIAEHVARFSAVEAKKKAHEQLRLRLAQEKQFNRKVELNGQLRDLDAELASLQHS